jgi:hypothetical protein
LVHGQCRQLSQGFAAAAADAVSMPPSLGL